MTNEPQPTKRERKEAARAERIEQEQSHAAAAARKKRLGIFGAILVAAVAIVIGAILITSGKDNAKNSAGLQDVDKVLALYKGIPQKGITLGEPSAKATVVIFADPQCPFCRDFEITELPGVVEKSVRTGKAKLELRMRAFLGDDSVTAANALYAASFQNTMFETSGILYHNQGEENTGWVTDSKLREILGAVPANDVDKAMKDADGDKATGLLGEAETLAGVYGSQSTPDIYIGTTGKNGKKTDATEAAITKAVDALQ